MGALSDLNRQMHDRLSALSVSHGAHHTAPVRAAFGFNPHGNRFIQTNLVTDGLEPAANTDPALINPWGIAQSPNGTFWVSDNGTGLSTLYAGNGVAAPLQVTIATPPGDTNPASPTGQVFNSFVGQNAFELPNNNPALFMFATEDGTISGWNGGTQSVLKVDNSANPFEGKDGLGAVYKGLAIGDSSQGPMLYAANFRHDTVDVFNTNFQQVGSFTDPTVPVGYAPFNVQELNGNLFVTFAKQDATAHDDVAGKGHGFVDEFSNDGTMIARIASKGPLDSPWGLAIAPQGFGAFAGDLLVGNFGNGEINAFDLTTHKFAGTLLDPDGKPLVIGDLWAIAFGNGAGTSSTNTLYFTAGVQGEAHGLFGALNLEPNLGASAAIAAHHSFQR